MAKVDPREKVGQSGPVRTSSGTRAAVRVAPLPPDVTSLPVANDVHHAPEARDESVREEMPTRELDLEQIRAMALRCASDVGVDEPRLVPVASPQRPHLELVLVDEPDRAGAAIDPGELPRTGPWASLAAAVVVVVLLSIAVFAALAVYGALP